MLRDLTVERRKSATKTSTTRMIRPNARLASLQRPLKNLFRLVYPTLNCVEIAQVAVTVLMSSSCPASAASTEPRERCACRSSRCCVTQYCSAFVLGTCSPTYSCNLRCHLRRSVCLHQRIVAEHSCGRVKAELVLYSSENHAGLPS